MTDFNKQAMDRPLAVVSCDGHAGPRLVEDLRPYCPKAYLSTFDEFAARIRAMQDERMKSGSSLREPLTEADGSPNLHGVRLKEATDNLKTTAGHYDIPQRLRDMDADGVVAEVAFFGSHNGEVEPFIIADLLLDPVRSDLELFSVGTRIYAEWLADACKQADGRIIGLVTPPLWDVDASIETVKWGHKNGLKGVNLLMPRPGLPRYDRPQWEPFWAVCEDLGMTLHTHAGAPPEDGQAIWSGGPAGIAAMEIESGGWPARKACYQMIFSGVFERHPNLKIIFTEQNFDWWVSSRKEFDSTYLTHFFHMKQAMSRKPSEYMASNVRIGASFMAPFEAEDAVRNDYTDVVIWGRDYGHIEGTFVVDGAEDPATNRTRMSMRYAFANAPPADVRKMVSDNGIEFLGLDPVKMAKIAQLIGSPSLSELSTPIQAIPHDGGILSFRTVGPWH